MRKLMISLDQWIAEPLSHTAERMRLYGENDDLFIIIPSSRMVQKELVLSQTVLVWETGGNKAQQFFRLLRLGKEIIPKYEISLITTQDPFFTGLVGWLLKRKFKLKLEVQLHGDFYSGDYYKKSGLMNLIRYYLGKWFVLKRTEVIRAVGERIKNSLSKIGIGEEKIVVKPIAVDVEKIREHWPKIDLHKKYPGYEKIFLVLGRLDPVKNISWLINLFAEVAKQRNYLLLIVGSGKDKVNIQYPISNIKSEPWTADPISYLKTVDCLLFPSLSEGYGLVPMEAHVAGCPVIMNDVGVANYELKPSEKVKILPINDKDAWIKAILEV